MREKCYLCVAVGLACLATRGQEAGRGDLDKMHGEWTPTTLFFFGQSWPKWVLPEFCLAVKEKEITLMAAKAVVWRLETSLDPSKSPKTWDQVVRYGPNKGKKALGIYELDGDTLKISIGEPGGPRAKDFSTPEDESERVVMILRRAK